MEVQMSENILKSIFDTIFMVFFLATTVPSCYSGLPEAIRADTPSPADEPLPEVLFSEPVHDPAKKVAPLPDGECTTYGMMIHFDSEAERLRAMLPPEVAAQVDEQLEAVYAQIEAEYSVITEDGTVIYGSIVGPLISEARAKAYENMLEKIELQAWLG